MLNIQSLNLKLNNGLHLDSPILLKSKINFTKFLQGKKSTHKKKYKLTLTLHPHYFRRQKIPVTNNTLETTKTNLKLVWQTIKVMINMKNKSDESISSFLIDVN